MTMPQDEARLHTLTDLCYAEISEENFQEARKHLHETEMILNAIKGRMTDEYRFKDEEALHNRNKGILSMHEGDYRTAIDLLLKSGLSLVGGKLEEDLVTIALPLVGIETICRGFLTDNQKSIIRDIKKRVI